MSAADMVPLQLAINPIYVYTRLLIFFKSYVLCFVIFTVQLGVS